MANATCRSIARRPGGVKAITVTCDGNLTPLSHMFLFPMLPAYFPSRSDIPLSRKGGAPCSTPLLHQPARPLALLQITSYLILRKDIIALSQLRFAPRWAKRALAAVLLAGALATPLIAAPVRAAMS